MRAALRLVSGLFLMAAGSCAWAHTLSETLSSWQIQDALVHMQITIPDLEAKRLSDSGKDLPSKDVLGNYLAERIHAAAGGEACAVTERARPLMAMQGFFRFEFTFSCPSPTDITIRSDAFYDLVPTHTNFARIENNEGRFFEQLLTGDHREVNVSGNAEENELASAGFLKYIELGIMHIFTGIDHMSFMLGLVLISRRIRDLLLVVTGFTLGHSLTLALAVTGILRPEAQYIDALVAFTIAMIGAENIGDSTRRPMTVALSMGGLLLLMAIARSFGLGVILPSLLLIGGAIFGSSYLMLTGTARDAGKIRLLMTLVFGLIHGFGFAANLLEMRLPGDRLAELLVGFNIGVEIGQVSVVLAALLVAYGLGRIRLAMPRPLFTDIASAFLVAEGLYWFVTRSMVL
ncbi:MAG: HupE/UreJ family protein [Pseudomonadales bacterium]|nr:HupE/UreJ family protein [Pseudomonadales bacterium]